MARVDGCFVPAQISQPLEVTEAMETETGRPHCLPAATSGSSVVRLSVLPIGYDFFLGKAQLWPSSFFLA